MNRSRYVNPASIRGRPTGARGEFGERNLLLAQFAFGCPFGWLRSLDLVASASCCGDRDLRPPLERDSCELGCIRARTHPFHLQQLAVDARLRVEPPDERYSDGVRQHDHDVARRGAACARPSSQEHLRGDQRCRALAFPGRSR